MLYKNIVEGSKTMILLYILTACSMHGVTNFIQLVSPQPVDQFSQTKLHWKAPNEGYSHICGKVQKW